MRNQNMQKFKT